MYEKLCDNLNILMQKAGINASELARRTGLPATTIKKIRNHDQPNPTLSTLIPLAQSFGVTMSQLIGEEGLAGDHTPEPSAIPFIPLLSWQQALNWPHTAPPFNYLNMEDYPAHYALTITESDWEGFPYGSVIYIHSTLPPLHRDFVVVRHNGQPLPTIKQLIMDDRQKYLKSVIPGLPLLAMTEHHHILGVVTSLHKQFKNK